jgi:8-oxo-dGTP pyrophosphatase MutT (NUDIX family)
MGSASVNDMARDGVEMPALLNGEDWRVAWYPPPDPPPGRPHGIAAVCLAGAEVILISRDGIDWDLPGGRPKRGEKAVDTLRREVREETCATVTKSRLLGFTTGTCLSGPQRGTTLVRSLWRAEVDVGEWRPEFEIAHRRIVPASDAFTCLGVPEGMKPIYRRFLDEALGAAGAPPAG